MTKQEHKGLLPEIDAYNEVGRIGGRGYSWNDYNYQTHENIASELFPEIIYDELKIKSRVVFNWEFPNWKKYIPWNRVVILQTPNSTDDLIYDANRKFLEETYDYSEDVLLFSSYGLIAMYDCTEKGYEIIQDLILSLAQYPILNEEIYYALEEEENCSTLKDYVDFSNPIKYESDIFEDRFEEFYYYLLGVTGQDFDSLLHDIYNRDISVDQELINWVTEELFPNFSSDRKLDILENILDYQYSERYENDDDSFSYSYIFDGVLSFSEISEYLKKNYVLWTTYDFETLTSVVDHIIKKLVTEKEGDEDFKNYLYTTYFSEVPESSFNLAWDSNYILAEQFPTKSKYPKFKTEVTIDVWLINNVMIPYIIKVY